MRHTDALANLVRLRASTHKVGARAVFLALIVRTDDNGLCWPGMETLAFDVGLSVSATRRNVARLVATGLVAVEVGGGRGHTNLYRLAVEVVPNPGTNARVSGRETLAFGALNPRVSTAKPSRPREPNVLNGYERAASPPICPLCGEQVTQQGKWRHPDCGTERL